VCVCVCVCVKFDCFGGLLKYNIIVIGFVSRRQLKIIAFREVIGVGCSFLVLKK
jgi:hypothetical protein